MSDTRLVYVGTVIHSKPDNALEILDKTLIAVDAAGIITHLLDASSDEALSILQSAQSDSTVSIVRPSRPHNAFLLPGFIDTHLHAPQYLYAGTALDEPLMVWLHKYTFQAESRIDADVGGLGRRVYTQLAKRLIQHGTTMAALYGTLSTEAKTPGTRRKGKHGPELTTVRILSSGSYYTETTSSSIAETERFIHAMQSLYSSSPPAHQKLVEPCITPRFIPTCSKELLKSLASMAREKDVHVQSHLSESGDEIAFTKSIWGDREDTEIFEEVGLLTSKSLFAHCTHLSLPDLAHLSKRGSSISHCPLSNMYFSERPFPLRQALDGKAKVGLGSDISGGYAIGIQESMRAAVCAARSREGRRKDGVVDVALGRMANENERQDISWKEAVYLATLGGARALNKENIMGNFQVGKSFDCQLIQVGDEQDGSMVDLFEDTYENGRLPMEILVEKWWCNGTPADRKAVFVAGRKLL